MFGPELALVVAELALVVAVEMITTTVIVFTGGRFLLTDGHDVRQCYKIFGLAIAHLYHYTAHTIYNMLYFVILYLIRFKECLIKKLDI